MEVTMNAATVGMTSQAQAQAQTGTAADSSLGSGFSDVLSDVRSTATNQTADKPADLTGAAETPAVQPSEISAESTVTAEQSDLVADALTELVKTLTAESGQDEDAVVKALLDILKKMQKNGEEGEAIDAVMELLASMIGQNVQLFQPTNVTVTVPEPSEEITQLTSEQPQMSVEVNNTVQLSQNAAESGIVQQPAAEADSETAIPEQKEQPEQATQTAQPEIAVPAVNSEDDAQQLLNELLSQAREELGLTKAEITPKNDGFDEKISYASPENMSEQPAENGQKLPSVQNNQDFDTFSLRLNHRDSTHELNSIINNESSSNSETTEFVPTQTVIQPQTAEIQPANEENPQVHAAPPEQQLAEEILTKTETLNGGRTEFTMELNPETLGKITVKLVSAHGRVEVSISAENEETGRLLQSRGENIGNALRESGIELERYQVVSEREDAQLMQDSYDGSSKNPYGRDDEENSENQDDGEFLELLSQL